ncbi:unnamed protein product [Rhizoctonia solani]|uniref:Protein BIG1 n=1 Tax=Rhizoctonia solani TaxID=456999 RepID=A0A8H3BQV8_9AGAM|nr:unnamed protein product [Rhizoctonia solani]
MRLMFASAFCALVIAQFDLVSGNTEILNFESIFSPAFPRLNVSRHTLNTQSSTRLFSLELAPYGSAWSDICDSMNVCPHEIFIKLDLEKSYKGEVVKEHERPRYSLRISSTPSPPSQFIIAILTPRQVYELFEARAGSVAIAEDTQGFPQTRTMYAHIRARNAGAQVPKEMTWHLFPPFVAEPSNQARFHLIIDPLLLGFIPKSVVPVIWAILVAVVLGVWSLWWVKPYLENLALSVHEQMKSEW